MDGDDDCKLDDSICDDQLGHPKRDHVIRNVYDLIYPPTPAGFSGPGLGGASFGERTPGRSRNSNMSGNSGVEEGTSFGQTAIALWGDVRQLVRPNSLKRPRRAFNSPSNLFGELGCEAIGIGRGVSFNGDDEDDMCSLSFNSTPQESTPVCIMICLLLLSEYYSVCPTLSILIYINA